MNATRTPIIEMPGNFNKNNRIKVGDTTQLLFIDIPGILKNNNEKRRSFSATRK